MISGYTKDQQWAPALVGSSRVPASNLSCGAPRPPQTSAGASGGGRGALVPDTMFSTLALVHVEDRATSACKSRVRLASRRTSTQLHAPHRPCHSPSPYTQ